MINSQSEEMELACIWDCPFVYFFTSQHFFIQMFDSKILTPAHAHTDTYIYRSVRVLCSPKCAFLTPYFLCFILLPEFFHFYLFVITWAISYFSSFKISSALQPLYKISFTWLFSRDYLRTVMFFCNSTCYRYYGNLFIFLTFLNLS